MEATRNSSQVAELEQQMRQADADWEAVTQSIQADQQCLETLQERLRDFRLFLSLSQGVSSGRAPAIAAQMQLLEQQMVLLSQRIRSQKLRRNAIEQRFDQARLARATLLRASPDHLSRSALVHKFPTSWMKRPVLRFWAFLERPGDNNQIIPGDLWLRRHASTGR
jgi:hypothetical protein